MQCPQCQYENQDGLRFCNGCGTPLPLRCSQCGFTNQSGSSFCGECGASLVEQSRTSSPAQPEQRPATEPQRDLTSYTPQHLAEKILTTRSALEGERKQVTVMFCDIKDSTELIRDLDPEAAQQLLDPAIHIMMEAVHHFEGTVNQVLGDGIMALFGAPIAHEDHAARACYAALAMQTAMKPYADDDFPQAHALLSQAVAFYTSDLHLRHERFGFGGVRSVLSRFWLVWCLAEVGGFAEGSVHGEEGSRVAEEVGQSFTLIGAYVGVGFLCLRKGEFHQAIPMLERGLELCQIVPFWFHWVASLLGAAYALSGRADEVLPLLEQAIEQGASMGQMVLHALWVARLGEAYLLTGRMEDASNLARQALDLARTHKERGSEAWILRLLGDIAMHRDPPEADQAQIHYQQALALANELGMRPLQAHCHRGLGMLYRQTGQSEQAHAELGTAIEMYRDMEMTFWLPETEAALAELEGKP